MNAFQAKELELFKEKHSKSLSLWKKSLKYYPGGVNHNVRTFGLPLIDAYPIFLSSSSDITLLDVDGIAYTDYWLGHYSQILGHTNSIIKQAVDERLLKGWMFGTVIEDQILFAEKISSIANAIEKLRFQTSGSESVMNALRLSRAYTKRDIIAKVDLGWHGTNETYINGSNRKLTEVEDVDSLSKQKIISFQLTQESIDHLFKDFGTKLACVIIEPIIGSGGAFKVDVELLKQLRESCDEYGVVLIFDEIISGFRFQYGLYQDKIGIKPDLTTLGKIIGGGFSIGGLGGVSEIMDLADPSSTKANKATIGGGTFSNHPVTIAAGIATLNVLHSKRDDFDKLNSLGNYFRDRLNSIFSDANNNIIATNFGSLIFVNCLTKSPWNETIPDIEILHTIDKKEQAFLQLSLLNRNIFGNHGIGALSFLHTKKVVDEASNTINEIVNSHNLRITT